MTSHSSIAPPKLEPENYESWRKEMRFWEMATNVVAKKRAPTVFLTLSGKAREAVLEMDPEELNDDEGLTKLYLKLDKLFKVDADQAALQVYEKFEKYSRPGSLSMADYRIEFDRMVQQLKQHKIELPEPVLAYRALKSANLAEEHERLVRATVSSITLDVMMTQLTKVMGMSEKKASDNDNAVAVRVKKEPDVNYSESGSSEINHEIDEDNEVLYSGNYQYGRYSRNNRGSRRGDRGGGRRSGRGRFSFNRGSTKKFNRAGPDGNPSKCAICSSVMHWARDCPHSDKDSFESDERAEKIHETHIVLMNLEEAEEKEVSLLGQTVGCTVLDSGCSRSVCGYVWYQCFLETLTEEAKKKIKTKSSESSFKFGNGSQLKSLFNVNLPCTLAGRRVEINADVIESEVPLLLSKNAMKKARMILNFKDDTVSIFEKKHKLQCTDSGHYFVPLTEPIFSGNQNPTVLFVDKLGGKTKAEKTKIAEKLHKQFSHPSGEKLSAFVRNSGVKDDEFLKMLLELPTNCEICLRYKKAKPKPVVGFPMAVRFNQTVAMDLKEIHGHKILHMIDHASRYSVAVKVMNKESKEIITKVLRFWVSYFGAPDIFLTDNGREFDNEEFRDMAQNLNIVVKTTAAQSPWSNGLVERHNGVLGNMVKKTIEDTGCTIDQALSWTVCAKNSLQNVGGFSPNQLVFGYNPSLPSVLRNQPPSFDRISSSELVANNLNALHSARQAFIQAESSEKLQRALRHQIRPTLGVQYSNGDMVFYKRNEQDRWMGPGTVIGSENKQVLVKHGGSYVRVHPYRLQKFNGNTSEILGYVLLDSNSASDLPLTENVCNNGNDEATNLDSTCIEKTFAENVEEICQ